MTMMGTLAKERAKCHAPLQYYRLRHFFAISVEMNFVAGHTKRDYNRARVLKASIKVDMWLYSSVV